MRIGSLSAPSLLLRGGNLPVDESELDRRDRSRCRRRWWRPDCVAATGTVSLGRRKLEWLFKRLPDVRIDPQKEVHLHDMRQCRRMYPMNLYVTRIYERAIRKLLPEDARREMEAAIVAAPEAAPVIRGTG